MIVDESLRFFVDHLQPRAIVLKGDWGVGKTFYWREKIVKGFFAQSNLKRVDRGYAYVSLFGLESIQQIKNALAYSYAENKQPGWVHSIIQRAKHYWRKLVGFFTRATSDEVTVGTNAVGVKVRAGSLLNDFAFLSIRRALICIDDIERRNQKLTIGDVLGLTSYLVDQRGCRVILILNYDALNADEKAEWNRSKDKTFENELLFKPTLEQSIEAGMRGAEHESWYALVKASLELLEIGNVRVIIRAQRFVRQLLSELSKVPELEAIDDESKLEIAKVGTLLASAHASKGVGAPDVLDIVNPEMIAIAKDKDDETLSDDQKAWKSKIESYGMFFGDSLDNAIARSVIDGYPRMDLLVPSVLEWDDRRSKHLLRSKFQSAWDLYHDSFANNAEEVYAAFMKAIPGIIATESVHNIESTGRILRVLGHPDSATRVFQEWVDARLGERRTELFDDSFFPGVTVTDDEFLALIASARKVRPKAGMSIENSLMGFDSGNWSEEAVQSIADADPSQISDVLVAVERDWRRCIEILGSYALHGDTGQKAKANFLAALKIIANSSALNADRVRNRLGRISLETQRANTEDEKSE